MEAMLQALESSTPEATELEDKKTNKRTLEEQLGVLMSSAIRFAVGLLVLCCAAGGCQPKLGSGENECACVCYLEDSQGRHQESQTIYSTKECGNVNGTPCTANADDPATRFNGQLANCGPNPNVARPKPWVPKPPDNPQAHQ